MTWVVTPPADHTEADERVHAVAVFATGSLDALWKVSAVLNEVIEHANETEDVSELVELDNEVRSMRDQLIEIFKIHRATLSRETVDDLREGFRLANLAGPEHEAKRKEITERVVGHDVERLAELEPEEAKALRAELTNLEPKF